MSTTRTATEAKLSTSIPERRYRRSRLALIEAWDRDEAEGRARWQATEQGLSVRMRVIDGVAVLRFEGELDRRAVSPCRDALHVAQRIQTPRIVLDLEAAKVDAPSIPLLAEIIRIAARHGTVVELVGFPPALRAPLARVAPAQIRLFPAVSMALETSLTEPLRNPGWRLLHPV